MKRFVRLTLAAGLLLSASLLLPAAVFAEGGQEKPGRESGQLLR